jgi:hypothetical protein
MAQRTKDQRQLWKAFECQEDRMEIVPFGPDRIRIAPPTAEAWQALAAVLEHHQYNIRTTDTDSYNCRTIKGSKNKSLHSYGIALDVNWTTNPFLDHAGKRAVRYSTKSTQEERAEDVRLGRADTDMSEAMIADVLKIATRNGKRVFEWGGQWSTTKDCMHFEIDVSPEELASGIDSETVTGWAEFIADTTGVQPSVPDASEMSVPETAGLMVSDDEVPVKERRLVIARHGLHLRRGPSTDFAIEKTVAPGTEVFVIGRDGLWAQVDLRGDGLADGYMVIGFLKPIAVPSAGEVATRAVPGTITTRGVPGALLERAISDITGRVTPEMVKSMFPATPLGNISKNLPFVLDGLRQRTLGDRSMVLMALSTIRAETEGFLPISEGRSKFNTRLTPFDLYDHGTSIGVRLGNTQPGDGPRFKGRGYVQLTGRDNYTRVSSQINVDLISNPDRANDPTVAGIILAQFLKNQENGIRAALSRGDLRGARKKVNGGSHGLAQFTDAFHRGERVLPV